METFAEVMYTLKMDCTSCSTYDSVRQYWSTDVEYELLTRSDESGCPNAIALARALTRTMAPVLRLIDFCHKPFPLGPHEELILFPDPAARARALRLARAWVSAVGKK